MEKEKKTVKEEKKITKVERKSTNNIVFTKDIKIIVKILAIMASFIATIVSIFVFVFGIITSLNAANLEKSELLHDNFSVTFISNVNCNTIIETENIIKGYGSKALFIIFDIVLPSIALITVMILLVIFSKQLLDFINSVTKENELFTKDKLNVIEKLTCLIAAMLTISLIFFGSPSIIIYLFISVLLFIVIGLFGKCVENQGHK